MLSGVAARRRVHPVRIAGHPYAREDEAPPDATPAGDPIVDILDLLRNRTGVDFTHYKQTTIRRRILRRMALRNLQTPTEYFAFLHSGRCTFMNLRPSTGIPHP